MQSSDSFLGKQFLRSEGEEQEEQEQEQEQENQTVKTKKAPLREGPKYTVFIIGHEAGEITAGIQRSIVLQRCHTSTQTTLCI